jgi:hypothetical protein
MCGFRKKSGYVSLLCFEKVTIIDGTRELKQISSLAVSQCFDCQSVLSVLAWQ